MQTIFPIFFRCSFYCAKYNHCIIELFYEEHNQSCYSLLFCRYTLHWPFKIFWLLLTQIKGILQEIGKGSSARFSWFRNTEVLILFVDVPTSYHTRTTRLVVPGAKAGTLLIWNDCRCHRSLQINFKVGMVNIAEIEEYLFV